uniref:Uncharacterized protein orf62 n=1 Tax=Monomastix sp. (strain OKE-1) TaxID=141716 RepID=C0JWK9_MONSK|nr:hypothetical protein MoOKC_p025 [Monomastix sp. OKE-1]ACK36932.1 unknown [Monomastix sp. OKE-1]
MLRGKAQNLIFPQTYAPPSGENFVPERLPQGPQGRRGETFGPQGGERFDLVCFSALTFEVRY